MTGAGHSNAYEDPGAYSWAVKYLLSTDSPSGDTLPPLKVEDFSMREAKNDYELPWILRGVMDDPAVKHLFDAEIAELKENILSWQPTTRALKDIKKRVSDAWLFFTRRSILIIIICLAGAYGRESGATTVPAERATTADIIILVSCVVRWSSFKSQAR